MESPEKKRTQPSGTEPAPSRYFTGAAWIKTLVKSSEEINCTVSEVTFQPGARNNWHTHPGGQILLVTAGVGYFQRKGDAIKLIKPGDTITIPSGEIHWHGASHDSSMTHLAINMNSEKGSVEWLAPVTDKEYDLGLRF